jgi:hypothetical protein
MQFYFFPTLCVEKIDFLTDIKTATVETAESGG